MKTTRTFAIAISLILAACEPPLVTTTGLKDAHVAHDAGGEDTSREDTAATDRIDADTALNHDTGIQRDAGSQPDTSASLDTGLTPDVSGPADVNPCAPGELQSCSCANLATGSQACAEDGLSWQACRCGDPLTAMELCTIIDEGIDGMAEQIGLQLVLEDDRYIRSTPLSEVNNSWAGIAEQYAHTCDVNQVPNALQVYQAALNEGKVIFDVVGIRACQAEADALFGAITTVGEFADAVAASEHLSNCTAPMINGLLAAGEPCTMDWECGHALNCEVNVGDNTLRCLPSAIAGEACGPKRSCGADLQCMDGLCVQRPGLGEACGSALASCVSSAFCNDNSICAARIALGQSCANGETCASGLVCSVNSTCQERGLRTEPCGCNNCCAEKVGVTCRPTAVGVQETCRVLAPEGAHCLETSDCRRGTFCGADQTCAALLAAGQACESKDQCQSNICYTTCKTRSTLNQACSPEQPCETSLSCVDQACVATGNIGDPCSSNSDCSKQLDKTRYCQMASGASSGTCQVLPGDGQPCTTDLNEKCTATAYCDNSNVCRDLGSANAACDDNKQCASDWCFNNTCTPEIDSCATNKGTFASLVMMGMLGLYIPRSRRQRQTTGDQAKGKAQAN